MIKWLEERAVALATAVGCAVVGAVVDRYFDEANAWVRSIFIGGFEGTYILKSWTYPEHGPTNLGPHTQTVELKDTGRTVFGVITSQESNAQYHLFGYHRVKFLAISFGGRGPLGGGTLALQTEIASGVTPVFWGWRTGVECIGPDAYY